MNLFYERRKKVRADLDLIHETDLYKELPRHKRIQFNCQFMLNAREGQYLIKVSRKNKRCYYGEDNLYLRFTYCDGGWLSFGTRKEAQWFTGHEVQEWIKTHKGFTIVKK